MAASSENKPPLSVLVIGAGPAGLTTAYCLLQQAPDAQVTVLESDPKYVGGIARTVNYNGFRFDIGGHRFFSKSKRVEDLWSEILPNDMLDRPRSSRIFYRGQLFSYPLRAFEALFKLGVFEAARCMGSYAKARMFPIPNPRSFEDWVTNMFGKRLFSIFFKTYTEKVWGMDCSEISADWAAQRIKGLSMASAIKHAIFPPKQTGNRKDTVKSLIDTFRYPRLGPGMMWEVCAEKISDMGGKVVTDRRVEKCVWDADAGVWTVTAVSSDGTKTEYKAANLVSSAALHDLGHAIEPKPSAAAMTAADSLKYREFITVVLMMKERDIFSDNWIYIHEPGVKVGRIQNFKSWSPELVPDQDLACYGLEYFCFEGDGLWESSDEELIKLGASELEKLGLAKASDNVDGCVVRQVKAYPVYDDSYAEHQETIRNEFEQQFPTLHMIGRNGMHKYNNQDHAMMTGMLTVENLIAGTRIHDIWKVNQDAEYHESGEAGEESSISGMRAVPTKLPTN